MRVACSCGAVWEVPDTMGECPQCGQVANLPSVRVAREMERELRELLDERAR